MVVLIAEDLLLLLTDDETGKLAASTGDVDLVLGGALLVELAMTGRVDIAGPGDEVPEGRLVVRDDATTSDALLDEALAIVGGRQGKKPSGVVPALGKGVRRRLYDRLVDRGILRAESGKILGIFPRHTWPAQDAAHENAVRVHLVAAVRDAHTGDERTAALISLLVALKAVPKVIHPADVGQSKQELNANAKRLAADDWGSAAVRRAIDSAHAALIATITASGSGGS